MMTRVKMKVSMVCWPSCIDYFSHSNTLSLSTTVRNRSRELVELLSDVEKIRAERRKAKNTKHKYIGTGNDGFGFAGSGSRYGGFGNDSFASGGSYGNGD